MLKMIFRRRRMCIVLSVCTGIGATWVILVMAPYCRECAVQQALKFEVLVDRLPIVQQPESSNAFIGDARFRVTYDPSAVAFPYRLFCPACIDSIVEEHKWDAFLAHSDDENEPLTVGVEEARSGGCFSLKTPKHQKLSFAADSPYTFNCPVRIMLSNDDPVREQLSRGQGVPMRFSLTLQYFPTGVEVLGPGLAQEKGLDEMHLRIRDNLWWVAKLPEPIYQHVMRAWFENPSYRWVNVNSRFVDVVLAPPLSNAHRTAN